MMTYKLAFKYIFSVLVIISISCSEIERDNILDPKNSSSKRESVVLLEAFINTNTDAPPYNFHVLDAIDFLSESYGSRMLWVEYHRATNEYSDPLAEDGRLSSIIGNTYNDYTINYKSGRTKGAPDLFINGAENRVQGASNADNVVTRTVPFASEILDNSESLYTIEAEVDKANLSGKYRVARLGNHRSDKLKLRILYTYDSGETGKRTVSYISDEINIDEIDPGKFFEGDFVKEDFGPNINLDKVEKAIFILKDENDTKVLYAIEKQL
jgi:hypothetical protein